MIFRSNLKHRAPRPQMAGTARTSVRELAEAGASGHALTPVEVKAVCEALRVRDQRAQTHFHSGFGC